MKSVYYFYDGSKPPEVINLDDLLHMSKNEGVMDDPFVKDHALFKDESDKYYNQVMSFNYYIMRNPTAEDFRYANRVFGLPLPTNIADFEKVAN